MKMVLMVVALWIGLPSLAGEGDYAVAKIPASLLKNANVVKRMERIQFEVVNTGYAVLKKKYALTIMNENGDGQAGFVEYYDKLHEVKNIEGTLYDAGGKELKRLRNRQILDVSGVDDNNLIDDNRRKFHHFFHKVYPYTVEYEVEIRYNGTLFFPAWLPREDENYAVEQSSITVTSAASYTVRYKAYNYPGEPVISTEKDKRNMSWEVKSLPAVEDEYASPNWTELNTAVLFGPTRFEIENYKGDMSNWQEFGKFVYTLKQGRDKLPDNIKQTVHQIADPVSDTREKVVKLYEYLQKNTRYISVQLGIGGWQPFEAKDVAAKAYGDCKALTNYMYSLLKEAGIPSSYTLVKAGRRATPVIADFPAQQFNHVILAVPLKNDTMWLECTDQTLPAGYLGEFTCDRYALMINENGGTLVRTPRYSMKDNLQVRTVNATLDEEGTLNVKATTSYGGLQQDMYHGLIHSLSKDKVKEFLQEQLDFATYEVSDFSYKETKAVLPAIEESLGITVSNYATVTGKRLFIVPNIMSRSYRKFSVDKERKYELDVNLEYRDLDTAMITLPAGYTPEAIPQDVSLNSKFGKYSATVRLAGNQLMYVRSMEQNAGRFPASDYPEMAKFFNDVYKADRNRVVLVK